MSKFSVKKPFTVLVMVVVMLILGFVSLTKMKLDLLPEISMPYLIVIVTYPGASPEKVESQVCEPLEATLGTISGVENVYSVANENYGMVQLEFQDDTNMDSAMVRVSSAIDSVEEMLPEECGTPSIMEISTDMMATQYLAVSMEGMDIEELSKFVENKITPQFERQDGVASVSSLGMIEKSIQVELDADKIEVLNDKILAKTNDALADALEDLEEARKKLNDGQKKIDDSRKELVDGQKDLDEGKDELFGNWMKWGDGKDQLDQAAAALKEQEKATYAQLAQASEALDQLAAYKTQLTQQEAMITAIEAGVAAQVSESLKVMFGEDTSSESYKTAYTAAYNTAMASPQVADKIASIKVEIQVTNGIINTYQQQLDAMGVDYQNIEKAKLEAASQFGTANAQMASSKAAVESAKAQLEAADKSMETAQEQIDKGWDSLKDGQKQMDDSWKSFNDGLRQYEKSKVEALRNANADQLLTLSTLSGLIYAQNFSMPAGYVDDKDDNSWLVKVGENYKSVDELAGIVLCHIDDIGDVRLSDVANVTVIDNSKETYARLNGEQAVILSVFKSSTAGTNDVSNICKKVIGQLEEKYAGLDILIMMDQGDYINIIVSSVLQSMVLGAILAIVILAIFLKDILPTLVVAISIPLSVLTALIAMYFSGISLNMMSLSGLSLGIGMLVDNSVVVIENIYRLRSRGISAARAAVAGAKQVGGAIIASTLTTVCVFLPMIYTTGMVRELLMPMCLTIIFCLMASLLIAMTVVPAAGSTLLRNSKAKEHPWFDKIQDAYGSLLRFCLKVKIVPLAVAVGLLAFSIWLVVRMGIVLIPEMTSNQIEASLEFSEDMSREDAYAKADELINKFVDIKGVGSVGVMSGNGSSLITTAAGSEDDYLTYSIMIMTEDEKAGASEVQYIVDEMNRIANETLSDPENEFSASTGMSEMGSMLGSGLSLNIYGDDLDELLRVSEEVMEVVAQVPGYIDISNGQEESDPVLHVILNKDFAMSKGLTVAQIYQELAGAMTTTSKAVKVNVDGTEMDIEIVDNTKPITYENLMDYTFAVSEMDEDDDKVTVDYKLSDLAEIRVEDGFNSIRRENQSRYITVTANVEEGANTTLLTRDLIPLLENYKETRLPEGCNFDIGGEYDTVNEMVEQMALVMLLGVAFIYLVMVAQFQSLLSPFIVLFTLPLAFTGGFLALWITGEPLSMMGLMGLVILLGTVVNNGIVFVDYANQLRIGGMERWDALIATGKTRMRPILMTALTTILAMIYLVFGDDMGSQMGKGMALVIVGGLAYATLMTLFIIPVMYDILFKRAPLQVDVGSENLDDVPDDAADFLEQMRKQKMSDESADVKNESQKEASNKNVDKETDEEADDTEVLDLDELIEEEKAEKEKAEKEKKEKSE